MSTTDDDKVRLYSKVNQVVSIVNIKWELACIAAFQHIKLKGQNYDSEYIDQQFETIQLAFTTSQALCTLFGIPFLLPALEASEFRKAAIAGDRSYIQKRMG